MARLSARTVRWLVALACSASGLVTLILAVRSETGPDVTLGLLFLTFLMVAPFALYVVLIVSRRASVSIGLILSAVTAWWILVSGDAMRHVDDGLEFLAPYAGSMLNLFLVFLVGVLDRSRNGGSRSAATPPDTSGRRT